MTLSQRLALGSAALLMALIAVQVALTDDADAPVQPGLLAGPCRAQPPVVVAIVDADEFVDGAVRAIRDTHGMTFLLQSHHWSVVRGSDVRGPYGSSVRGAPGYISDAVDVDVFDSTVYVLDAAARRLVLFDDSGRYRRFMTLPQLSRPLWQPTQLFVDSTGISVLAFEAELNPPAWSLLRLRYGAERWERLLAIPGTSFEGLVGSAIPGGLLLGEKATYRLMEWSAGKLSTVFTRADPPRYGRSSRDRARYDKFVTRMPLDLQPAFTQPDYLPPLDDLQQISAARVAASLVKGPDSLLVEIITAGKPACTLTPHALPRPISLQERGVMWLEDEGEQAVLRMTRYPDGY